MSGLRERLGLTSRGVTVPPMDGALKPNRALEEAAVLVRADRPDNLARDGEDLLFSSGEVLNRMNVDASSVAEVARFDSEITALAADGAGGYAVGLDSGAVVFGGAIADRKPIASDVSMAPTALVFGAGSRLYLCSGSAANRPSGWKRDLVERNASGSVWAFDPASGRGERLADGLAFPYGLAFAGDALLVSESWRHRLVRIATRRARDGREPQIVLDDLPGYPARIEADDDGYWLSIFAPRGQLMELVLREHEYRRRMMATVDPEYWMAPALWSGRSFLEPLQLGAIRTMGSLKAWAPTRSFGLLVRLDRHCRPTGSAHSRSDGKRHGITSSLRWDDRVLVASKGGDVVLSLDVAAFAEV